MSKIAVSIKTHSRPELLRACINSLNTNMNVPFRAYIVDDSPASADLLALHDDLASAGHYVLHHPEPLPVTRARNNIIDSLEAEDYVLRMDDDFRLTEESDIPLLISLLESNPPFGAISGLERQLGNGRGTSHGHLSPHQGFFTQRGSVLHKFSIPVDAWLWTYAPGGARFAIADFTRNLLLIRRDVFTSVRWREDLWFHGEHEAFMLDLKRNGWLLAFTPDTVHIHDEVSARPKGRPADAADLTRSAMNQFFWNTYGIRDISLSYPAGKA